LRKLVGDVKKAFSDETSNEEFQSLWGVPKPEKDGYLIFSCRTGRRSGMAIEQILPFGYTK
jgi:hypothetical protein